MELSFVKETKDDSYDISKLVKQVRDCRRKKGLSQRELSEHVGMRQQDISRFEMEVHVPGLSRFLRILDAVGLEIVLVKK